MKENKENLYSPYLPAPTLLQDREISFYKHIHNPNLDRMTIFVFGSNEAGRHGKGAAKDAITHYGAILGRPEGFQGESYAIPTKDKHLRPLPLSKIKEYVDKFCKITNSTDEIYFFVTAIGTGLSGYKHKQIAPLFKNCRRCWFPHEWREYIDENYKKIEENKKSSPPIVKSKGTSSKWIQQRKRRQ